jgi:hypothetical protein
VTRTLLTLALLLGACTDPVEPAPDGGQVLTGDSCLTGADCESGACEGEGCGDIAGVCVPAEPRRCASDLRDYCSCDGETFTASSTCPGDRFSHRGACQ